MDEKENKKIQLLLITQKLDINDDLLGFMHDWVGEFARRSGQLTAIALGVGEYHLPENVRVLSLGKEKAPIFKKIKYVFKFFNYIWRERRNYDSVLVHMNKEYMILGGIFWRLAGKKAVLWYNHKEGNFWSRLAGILAWRIFYTSKYSFFARQELKKGRLMPVGVNSEAFKPQENSLPAPSSLLFLGRISPIKNPDILIEAAKILDEKGQNFALSFVGEAGRGDLEYFSGLKSLAKELEAKGRIKFLGKISNQEAPDFYQRHEIFINLTNSGSFDKTILEAMACGRLVLVSNRACEDFFNEEQQKLMMFQERNAKDLAEKIEGLLGLTVEEKQKLSVQMRKIVVARHSLRVLADKLFETLTGD